MTTKYYFQDLSESLQDAWEALARWCLELDYIEDDIREFGEDMVINEKLSDIVNRHNTAKLVSQWFRVAENINKYL